MQSDGSMLSIAFVNEEGRARLWYIGVRSHGVSSGLQKGR